MQLFDKLINIGNTEDLSNLESSKLRIQNMILMLYISGVLLISLISFITTGSFPFLRFVSLLIASSLLLLTKFGLYVLVRHMICFVFPALICLMLIKTQGFSIAYIIYLQFIMMAIVLYDSQFILRTLNILWNITLGIITYHQITHLYQPDAYVNFSMGSIIVFVTVTLFICFLIHFYLKENKKYRDQQKKLITSLKNQNATIERFNFIASHDLKSHALSVKLFAKMAQDNAEKEELSTLHKSLQFIERNSNHIMDIVEDTLEWNYITKKIDQHEEVNLNDIFEEIEGAIKNAMPTKKILIYKDNLLPTILAPRKDIYICFKNIIENAIKFNVNTEKIIRINCLSSTNKHLLTIKDNGIGVSENYLEQVFEMYKKLHSKDNYAGSGLGLTTSKVVIENLNGKIWMESDEKQGSTVFIELLSSLSC